MVIKNFTVSITVLVFYLIASLSFADPSTEVYVKHPKAAAFVDKMVKEHKFERVYVEGILNQAEKKQSILDAISRPAEKTMQWHDYRRIFLGEDRIRQGVEFWKENAQVLNSVSKQYGVEPEIIVAIIGVETRYGRHMGNYRVIDALATLGFDYPPRAKFFAGQLEAFLLLAREQKQDPLTLMGSYAGAMGYGQFIPSSYRSFARDNDADGFADIWNNKSDAIGSVANYFKAHGWQTGDPVFAKARVVHKLDDEAFNNRKRPKKTLKEYAADGVVLQSKDDFSADTKAVALRYKQKESDEYWFGFNNFYVITRYNHSRLYAKAVWDLSQAILDQHTSSSKAS